MEAGRGTFGSPELGFISRFQGSQSRGLYCAYTETETMPERSSGWSTGDYLCFGHSGGLGGSARAIRGEPRRRSMDTWLVGGWCLDGHAVHGCYRT